MFRPATRCCKLHRKIHSPGHVLASTHDLDHPFAAWRTVHLSPLTSELATLPAFAFTSDNGAARTQRANHVEALKIWQTRAIGRRHSACRRTRAATIPRQCEQYQMQPPSLLPLTAEQHRMLALLHALTIKHCHPLSDVTTNFLAVFQSPQSFQQPPEQHTASSDRHPAPTSGTATSTGFIVRS